MSRMKANVDHLKVTEKTMWEMLDFLIDNVCEFGEKTFSQEVDIPMGTNCAPFFVDLFLMHKNQIIAWIGKIKARNLAKMDKHKLQVYVICYSIMVK